MEPEYLKLLKNLLHANKKDAAEICEKILKTSLKLPNLSPSLISVLEMYYGSIASEYCSNNSEHNKAKLEKVISEIEELNFTKKES